MQEGAGFIGVDAEVVAHAIDLEFGAQAIGRQLANGRRVAVVDQQAQGVAPAAASGQGMELVLTQNVRGEAVGVGRSAALGLGQQVDFPVRLLERLGDLQGFDALAPGEDLFQRSLDGVPETHFSRAGKTDVAAVQGL
ncbi:hypothetical protein D9M73_269480 [compost metagenome]